MSASFMEYPDFFTKGEPPCASTDPDAFFPDPESPNSVEMAKLAKKTCSTCFYKDECLEWALKSDEIGIWGGTTEAERRRMKRGIILKPRKQYNIKKPVS